MAARSLFDGSSEPSPPLRESADPAGTSGEPLGVSELVAKLKQRLEPPFAGVWVAGEISDFRGLAPSGHAYFSLKDSVSMLRAKMWRSSVTRLGFVLENGAAVVAHGNVELYAPRGELSMVIDRVVLQGVGAAAAAFEQLRKKLLAEGLFEASRKRALPFLPRAIGLVTSRDGAAIRDFLKHLHERWPSCVVVAPTQVQGAGADASVAGAIRKLSERAEMLGLDAVAVVRGGGSIEDLAAFNSEAVARAIAECAVPVVTGVGHEIDTTIADLVADRRAKTPTDAANVLVPDRAALSSDLWHLGERMAEAMDRRLADGETEWRHILESSALAGPEALLEQFQLDLESVSQQMAQALRESATTRGSEWESLRTRLAAASPLVRVADQQRRFEQIAAALAAASKAAVERAERGISLAAATLEAVSPVAVLGRGYSLARIHGSEQFLTDTSQVREGDLVETRLAHGAFQSRVTAVTPPRSSEAAS